MSKCYGPVSGPKNCFLLKCPPCQCLCFKGGISCLKLPENILKPAKGSFFPLSLGEGVKPPHPLSWENVALTLTFSGLRCLRRDITWSLHRVVSEFVNSHMTHTHTHASFIRNRDYSFQVAHFLLNVFCFLWKFQQKYRSLTGLKKTSSNELRSSSS